MVGCRVNAREDTGTFVLEALAEAFEDASRLDLRVRDDTPDDADRDDCVPDDFANVGTCFLLLLDRGSGEGDGLEARFDVGVNSGMVRFATLRGRVEV